MSDILIRGMEMPKNCGECLFKHLSPTGESLVCDIDLSTVSWEERPFNCPLVHVQPHGRLIDADALIDSFDPSDFWNPDAEDNCFAAVHVVNCAPTIIPASEEGET